MTIVYVVIVGIQLVASEKYETLMRLNELINERNSVIRYCLQITSPLWPEVLMYATNYMLNCLHKSQKY